MRRRFVLFVTVCAGVAASLIGPGTAAPATAAPKNLVKETRRIGTSVQGRPIHALRMGNPRARHKVVVLGSMHGDERAGTRMIARLVYLWVSPNADVWVIPTMNPDGSAANRRHNARGVDLNRNFPYHWAPSTRGSRYYSGTGPASEPETRAVVAFLGAVRPAYVASFHQPLYGVGSERKNPGLVSRLAARLRLPVKSFTCRSVCRGTLTDWYNATYPGTAVTVEFGAAPSSDTLYWAAVPG
jgi:protein MpaA